MHECIWVWWHVIIATYSQMIQECITLYTSNLFVNWRLFSKIKIAPGFCQAAHNIVFRLVGSSLLGKGECGRKLMENVNEGILWGILCHWVPLNLITVFPNWWFPLRLHSCLISAPINSCHCNYRPLVCFLTFCPQCLAHGRLNSHLKN